MTPEERKRGALERFLAYCLNQEFETKEQVVEYLVYSLPDTVLEDLVKQFNNGNSTLPPLIPKSNLDRSSNTIFSRNINFKYVNENS